MQNNTQIAFAIEFTDELNRLRKSPESFVPTLKDRLQIIKTGKDDISTLFSSSLDDIQQAIDEAIIFLEVITPVNQSFSLNPTLCKMAHKYTHMQSEPFGELVDIFIKDGEITRNKI